MERGTDRRRGKFGLTDKSNGLSKEAKRTCPERLTHAKIDSGLDPDDFSLVLNQCRDLLKEMGQTVQDERREDNVLQALRLGTNRQLRHQAHGTHSVCRHPFALVQL